MSLLLNKNEIENHTTMVLDELLRDIEKDINDTSKDKTETRSAQLKIKMQLDEAKKQEHDKPGVCKTVYSAAHIG